MNDASITVDKPVLFQLTIGTETHRVTFRRLSDGSAYINGHIEMIFEGDSNAWKSALRYLDGKGYRETTC